VATAINDVIDERNCDTRHREGSDSAAINAIANRIESITAEPAITASAGSIPGCRTMAVNSFTAAPTVL